MKNSDLYMGGEEERVPLLVPLEEADTYSFEKESDNQMTYIVAENKNREIFDIQNSKTKLTYWHNKKMKRNQLFIVALGSDGSYKLYVMGDCIGYSEKDKFFKRLKCDDNDENQSFEVIPIGLKPIIKEVDSSPLVNKIRVRRSLLDAFPSSLADTELGKRIIRRTTTTSHSY
ncbi:hypothetical protein DMUE_0897 [Dictyocoela muelleri]|nr:hypothetical protein DMUE_0897 [Dictyocoela muelleri]